MNRNRIITLGMTLALLITAGTASASNAPTSQFGFRGWPYRQTTPCDGRQSDSKVSVVCTPQPTVTPTPCATDCPVTEPTLAPTSEPTLAPTLEPTLTPTPEPTLTPTPQPIQHPTPTAVPAATKPPVATVSERPTATPSVDGADYTTISVSAQEANAFSLLNEDRAANGLPALALDPSLSALARLKSCDMNANHYFAHTSPTLGSAAEMLRANGYAFTSVGENIAHHATVEKAQVAFMSSSGHRTNILGSQWKKVGIGVCYDAQGFVYVTQLFVR